jgi:hypothetical protein
LAKWDASNCALIPELLAIAVFIRRLGELSPTWVTDRDGCIQFWPTPTGGPRPQIPFSCKFAVFRLF